MTQNNNNLSVLAWYTDIKYQNHRKTHAYGDIYPLFTPTKKLLPFQIVRPTRFNPISIVNLYRKDGTLFQNITTKILDTGLQIKRYEANGYDVILYPGILPMAVEVPEGIYYATISDGVQTWYSEMFTVVNDVSPYLKIEWYDRQDFTYENGAISYETLPRFKNVVYIQTAGTGGIGKPDYKFEEEGQDRSGFFFPTKQLSEKVYKFSFLAPEYLLDAMRIIRMSNFKRITYDGIVYDLDTFLIEPEWQDQGNLAGVTAEFECNTVVKKDGKTITLEDIGDFNQNDFDNDFDDIEGDGGGPGPEPGDWEQEKTMTLMVAYPFDGGSLTGYKSIIDGWFADFGGEIQNVLIPIFIGDIFDSYNTTGRRLDQNLDSSYANVDELIEYVADIDPNVKISLLPCLFTADGQTEKFTGADKIEVDEWNLPVKLEYGNSHPTLAHQGSKDILIEFVSKLVARYSDEDFLGDRLNWVSPVITGQMEFGYNFATGSSGSGVAIFEGYHELAIQAFRNWLPSNNNPNKYADIIALNTKWGTAYADFDDVQPPKTGKPTRTANDADFVAMLATPAGQDWWFFHAYLLYSFADELKAAITAVSPDIKTVFSFGGMSPNDPLVTRRISFDVLSWADHSDGVKTAFGSDSRNNTTSLTLDFLQNYLQKGRKALTEINYIDYTNENSPEAPNVVRPRMIESGRKAIENGCKDLTIITSPGSNFASWNPAMKAVFNDLKDYMKQNFVRSTNGEATVTVKELIVSGGQTGLSRWVSAGGTNANRVKFTLTNPDNPEPPPPGLSFTNWELTQLPFLVSGENDVTSLNTLGFGVFPSDSANPRSGFYPKHIAGDMVEFQEQGGNNIPLALQRGLADGFDNSFLHTGTGVPAANRYKWTLPGFGNEAVFWAQSNSALEAAGASDWGAVKNQSRQPDGTQILFRYLMLDIESGVSDFSKIEYYVKGMYNAAKAEVPDFVIIMYSYKPNNGFTYHHNGYSYDGDSVPFEQKFFPYSKHDYNETKAKTSCGILTDWFKGKDIWYNILVQYYKQCLPYTNKMYYTVSGTNTIMLQPDGQRHFREDYFSEVIRGKNITWSPAGNIEDISPQELNDYGWYRLQPEVYYSAHQFAGHYSEVFFRLRMLSNMMSLGDDVQNLHNTPNVFKTCGILRQDLEANPFTNAYRPVDRLTTDWYAGMCFTLLNNVSWFTGFTGGNIGLTQNGFWLDGVFFPGANQTVNEGQEFGTSWWGDMDTDKSGHVGNFRQVAARYRQMQAESRVCDLWQKSDKILTLCHPEQVINGQFPIVGRLQGKYLKLHGIEGRLEIGESFDLIIKNTKNNTTFTRKIIAKRVLNELIVLPDGTYNAQDIIIEYNNPVKPGLKRVNGRAESV